MLLSHMHTSVARCCDINTSNLRSVNAFSVSRNFYYSVIASHTSILDLYLKKPWKALILARGLLALESCVDANYQLSKGFSAETSGGLLVALPSLPSAQAGVNLHRFHRCVLVAHLEMGIQWNIYRHSLLYSSYLKLLTLLGSWLG